jgi:hypothetical protein
MKWWLAKKNNNKKKEDFEKIRQEIGAHIGEFFKMYMKVPAEQPEQEIKDENEKDKTKN